MGSQVAALTGTNDPVTTALSLRNGGLEQGPLGLHVPDLSRDT